MKKILLSSVIVFGSFIVVSAQTSKSAYLSKAQNNVGATSKSSAKASVPNNQSKAATKKAEYPKSGASKSKPKSAMSLVEAQQ
jgi:hypothetical protein